MAVCGGFPAVPERSERQPKPPVLRPAAGMPGSPNRVPCNLASPVGAPRMPAVCGNPVGTGRHAQAWRMRAETQERRPRGLEPRGMHPGRTPRVDSGADCRVAQIRRSARTHFRFAQLATVHNSPPVNSLPPRCRRRPARGGLSVHGVCEKLLTRILQVPDHLQVSGCRARSRLVALSRDQRLCRRWNARHRLMPDGNTWF